jgi:hypothetical protein
VARITPLAQFTGVDDLDAPPPRRMRPKENHRAMAPLTEYTREQQCEIAMLNREIAALRADNAWKADRIVELEHKLIEYKRKLYG